MMRMLFVTWNDGHPPAQMSLPPGTKLEQITSEPVWLYDGSQFMLDAQRVRSAYLIDVPDGTMISHVEPVDVAGDDTRIIDVEAEAPTQADWPRLKRPLDRGMST